jgi:hypothetical protein
MMQQFIDFVHGLFPLIDPYVKEQVDTAIKQFERSKKLET